MGSQDEEDNFEDLPKFTKAIPPTEKAIVEMFLRYSQEMGSPKGAIDKIMVETQFPIKRIKAAISKAYLVKEAKDAQEKITQEVIRDKVPIVKDIVDLTLTTVKDFLTTLSTDAVRKSELTVKDIRSLSEIAVRFNDLIRLEEGKTTANIGVNVNQTHTLTLDNTMQALARLKAIDPIFEYPALPDVEIPKDA